MRGTRCGRGLLTLVVASGLWASLSVAGGEPKLERVTLSVKEPRREHRAQAVRRGGAWVLPLRVVDPGRRTVTVYRGDDPTPAVLTETHVLENIPELPGFRCPVAEFFA